MNHSDNPKDSKEEILSVIPQTVIPQSSNSSNSPGAELEILKLINEAQGLEIRSKDNEISQLKKENDLLRKDNISLKKNFRKFYNLLFKILKKTNIDPELYESLSAEKGQISVDNALFPNYADDFPGGVEAFRALNEASLVSVRTISAPGETNRASDKTALAFDETSSAIDKTSSAFDKTLRASDGTGEASAKTGPAFDAMGGVSDKTNPASDRTNRTIDETNRAFDKTDQTSDKREEASNRTGEASDKTAHMNNETGKTSSMTVDINLISLGSIADHVIHKNSKHSVRIVNGVKKTMPNKHEIHTAGLIQKAINVTYKLRGYSDQTNRLIAYRLILALRNEFGSRINIINAFITMANMLLYFYDKKKFTVQGLCRDLGYSRSNFYRVRKILMEKQWLESYNFRKSDAYYFSETGRQFVESVLATE